MRRFDGLVGPIPAVAKRLRLGRIAASLPERLVLADKQEMSFDDLLLMLLADEIARRDNTAADNRAAEASLDPAMTPIRAADTNHRHDSSSTIADAMAATMWTSPMDLFTSPKEYRSRRRAW
jgi:hypothetical protein